MLWFHPILLFLTPVWVLGIAGRACPDRVVTYSQGAVLKNLHVLATSFHLLAPPLHLNISTQVPSISSGNVQWLQCHRMSFTKAIQVQQLSQHTIRGRELTSAQNFQAWKAMSLEEEASRVYKIYMCNSI